MRRPFVDELWKVVPGRAELLGRGDRRRNASMSAAFDQLERSVSEGSACETRRAGSHAAAPATATKKNATATYNRAS
jgi:hypothetical protein